MIWLLRISFSLLIAGCAVAATVSGKVELTGSQSQTVNRQKNYSGVVVWLETPAGTPPPTPRQAEMVQKNKTFIPHVLAVPVGSSVDFPNFDPIFHNAFSNYNGQLFDVGLYPPGTSRKVVFKREGVVRVFCNIHQSMSAVILVLNTPYFAVSKNDGSWSIPDVPPGAYTLRIFHERATAETLDALSRKLQVENDHVPTQLLVISETGYVQTPHANKFGKAYPPVPESPSAYPGAKR